MPFPFRPAGDHVMDVNGKKAIVVGGASGMGRATAEDLTKAGATVAILVRHASVGQDVAGSIGALFRTVDVKDFAAAESVLDETVKDLGGLHVIVTTAGGGIAKRTLSKSGPHDLDAFRRVLGLNPVATFNPNPLGASHLSPNEPEDE